MSVILRCTPDLPKLCEAGARNCYNSFNKATPTSHQLVKNLFKMPKPHLSIGHHGNILVCLSMPDNLEVKHIKSYTKSLNSLLLSLNHNSKGYLTITTSEIIPDTKFDAVISGNAVAFMNALKPINLETLDHVQETIVQEILDSLNSTPETMFFFNDAEGYAHVANKYLIDETMETNKLLVHDNYSDILTPTECEWHESATVALRTSRDMSMQANRHQAGISQLSQRYVLPFDLDGFKFKDFFEVIDQDIFEALNRFKYHVPIGIDKDKPIPLYIQKEDGDRINLDPSGLLWNPEMTYDDMMKAIETFFYAIFFDQIKNQGENHKRANEQARSILPNNMDTVVFYTRNKWQWRHYIDLRTDTHTQLENRRDSIPLLKSFQRVGWFTDLVINEENLTAEVK